MMDMLSTFRFDDFLLSKGSWIYSLISIFFIYCVIDGINLQWMLCTSSKSPIVGSLSWIPMPRFALNAIFAWKASDLLQWGYSKFTHLPFQMIRNDGRILVLPLTMLEELSALPADIANPQAALEHDLLGHFTGLNLIVENRLHHSIVQRKLTPRIPILTPRLESAVDSAFSDFFPAATEEWIEFQPYMVLGRISARVAADVIVGPAFCDNHSWLDVSFNYTENLFRTIVILRLFPSWMQGAISLLLPSYWQGKKYLKLAKHLLGPQIQSLIDKSNAGTWEPRDDNIDDVNLLNWLASMAKSRDRRPDVISHVLVLVALASVHTTLLRMVNVLYDITAAGSTLRDELLQEISSVAKDGWTTDGHNSPYDQLHRLDSVMRESQRLSPPTTLGLKRLLRKDHIFRDGTHVSSGTYVCMPIHAIENDEQHTPDPHTFDGLRSFRDRQMYLDRNSSNESKGAAEFLFSTPTRTSLNFGYGKTACPGRFFASVVIKMVLVKLLTEYDFAFLPDKTRPANLMAHEFLFTNPWQKILVRRKAGGLSPF